MSTERIELGKQGEEAVARYLRHKGFTICAQNYTTRNGEIDIIASTTDLMIFVEVKIRRTKHFNLSQVITSSKQKKITKTALRYIFLHHIRDMSYRFDVALLEISQWGSYTITYIADAFTAQEHMFP